MKFRWFKQKYIDDKVESLSAEVFYKKATVTILA